MQVLAVDAHLAIVLLRRRTPQPERIALDDPSGTPNAGPTAAAGGHVALAPGPESIGAWVTRTGMENVHLARDDRPEIPREPELGFGTALVSYGHGQGNGGERMSVPCKRLAKGLWMSIVAAAHAASVPDSNNEMVRSTCRIA